MADKVDGRRLVLEIGCGVGYSTLSLAQGGRSIVAIDENPNCLVATKARLEEHGFSAELRLRSDVRAVSGGAYEVRYGQVPGGASPDILLIEGDMLNDPGLESWLKNTHQFDAVVCWLLGTHQYRAAEHGFGEYGAADIYGFRIAVQNATYELADKVLKPQGILQVVDRGGFANDDRLIEGLKASHRDQASVTTLVVQQVDHLAYAEPDAENAMPMGWSPPDIQIEGAGVSEQFPALISVTSVKPGGA
ncbi:class I SAM-dependent methyltransferase [Paraburkholderia aspalathi]|uniref:Methyltransferase domain-containing protein n=1 Tax=Paraburkholderia aspalathi TaxID=1324617 RepID=A0A1I7B6N0_9BURK|nr:class I SAM-dependent methyltransferase [Paraburkholderia aspalathi]SFT82778.1 Methyltransferase domain-containing protein [Paraburkholderia aspalathi]